MKEFLSDISVWWTLDHSWNGSFWTDQKGLMETGGTLKRFIYLIISLSVLNIYMQFFIIMKCCESWTWNTGLSTFTFLVVSVVTKETDWIKTRVALVSQINAAAGEKTSQCWTGWFFWCTTRI